MELIPANQPVRQLVVVQQLSTPVTQAHAVHLHLELIPVNQTVKQLVLVHQLSTPVAEPHAANLHLDLIALWHPVKHLVVVAPLLVLVVIVTVPVNVKTTKLAYVMPMLNQLENVHQEVHNVLHKLITHVVMPSLVPYLQLGNSLLKVTAIVHVQLLVQVVLVAKVLVRVATMYVMPY